MSAAKRQAKTLMGVEEQYNEAGADEILNRYKAELKKADPDRDVLRILYDKLHKNKVPGYSNLNAFLPTNKKQREKVISQNLVVVDMLQQGVYKGDSKSQLEGFKEKYDRLGEQGQKGAMGEYLRREITTTEQEVIEEEKAAKAAREARFKANVEMRREEEAQARKDAIEKWNSSANERAAAAKERERQAEFERRRTDARIQNANFRSDNARDIPGRDQYPIEKE